MAIVNAIRIVLQPKVQKDCLLAIASCVVAGAVCVKRIRIVHGSRGLFLGFPSRKLGEGKFEEFIFPVSTQARDEITRLILEAYEAKVKEAEVAA